MVHPSIFGFIFGSFKFMNDFINFLQQKLDSGELIINTSRLTDEEKKLNLDGFGFAFDSSPGKIERWTDGHKWSDSNHFLNNKVMWYTCLNDKDLIKITFRIKDNIKFVYYFRKNQKLHPIYLFTQHHKVKDINLYYDSFSKIPRCDALHDNFSICNAPNDDLNL